MTRATSQSNCVFCDPLDPGAVVAKDSCLLEVVGLEEAGGPLSPPQSLDMMPGEVGDGPFVPEGAVTGNGAEEPAVEMGARDLSMSCCSAAVSGNCIALRQ